MAALLAIPAAIGSALSGATASVGGLSTIASAATIGSTILGTVGAIQQGRTAQTAARYEAEQLRQRGNEELATGQRRMFQAERNKRLALSTLASRTAGAGGDTTDPTIINLGGDIENRGETQALMEFYRGETAQARSNDAAEASIFRGSAARRASLFRAGGTILDGFTSLANRYAPRRPNGAYA